MSTPAPKLVAHRGYAREFPENTLLAVNEALRHGARFVEIDVQLTRDHVPVLFHDRTLERMCAAKGAVHERDADDLLRLACSESGRFGARFADERIATLEQFVEVVRASRAVFAFVEIKRVALEAFGFDRVLGQVLPHLEPIRDRVAVISFALDFLARFATASPIAVGAVVDRWEELEGPLAARLDPAFVFCDVEGLPADGRLVHRNARTVIYEVADPALARSLAARGVEFVETFAVREMHDALCSRAT